MRVFVRSSFFGVLLSVCAMLPQRTRSRMRRRAAVLIPGGGKRDMNLPSCGCFDEVLWVVHVEVSLNGGDLPSRGEESNFPRAENACGVLAAPRVRTLIPLPISCLFWGCRGHYAAIICAFLRREECFASRRS